MISIQLGRTNREFPAIWLGLRLPQLSGEIEVIQDLVSAAVECGRPIDISSQPSLWGGQMRGTEAVLSMNGTLDYARAVDDKNACDLTQAHLIETLSSIGREHIDFYFLRVRNAVEEFQVTGALQAMEMARQEGHIRYMGVLCDGPALATLGLWQFHDAFDVVQVTRSRENASAYDTLSNFAAQRRVGVITNQPTLDEVEDYTTKHAVIVPVHSASEVLRFA